MECAPSEVVSAPRRRRRFITNNKKKTFSYDVVENSMRKKRRKRRTARREDRCPEFSFYNKILLRNVLKGLRRSSLLVPLIFFYNNFIRLTTLPATKVLILFFSPETWEAPFFYYFKTILTRLDLNFFLFKKKIKLKNREGKRKGQRLVEARKKLFKDKKNFQNHFFICI